MARSFDSPCATLQNSYPHRHGHTGQEELRACASEESDLQLVTAKSVTPQDTFSRTHCSWRLTRSTRCRRLTAAARMSRRQLTGAPSSRSKRTRRALSSESEHIYTGPVPAGPTDDLAETVVDGTGLTVATWGRGAPMTRGTMHRPHAIDASFDDTYEYDSSGAMVRRVVFAPITAPARSRDASPPSLPAARARATAPRADTHAEHVVAHGHRCGRGQTLSAAFNVAPPHGVGC